MFTILLKACAVAYCTIVSGPVDWSKPHSVDLIWVAGHEVILGNKFAGAGPYDLDQFRSGEAIKKAVGSRPLVCKGGWGSHGTITLAKCYFAGRHGEAINVVEETHKIERGF